VLIAVKKTIASFNRKLHIPFLQLEKQSPKRGFHLLGADLSPHVGKICFTPGKMHEICFDSRNSVGKTISTSCSTPDP